MPFSGRSAFLKLASVVGTPSTNNAATRSTGPGASTPGWVQINSTLRRHWDPDLTPALYRTALGSTTLIAASLYAVNPVQGKFTYLTGDPSTGVYTIDANYLTVSSVAGGRAWEASVEMDMFDTTEFGSSGWKRFMSNMAGTTVTIEKFWVDAAFFDRLNLGSKFLIELGINLVTNDRYEGFAYLSGLRPGAAVDSLVNENITLSIDGPLYFST